MTWLTIFPLRFHLAERYPLHDKILHPHLARFDPLTFVPMRENRSINFIQRVENFNLSSIRFFFNLFSFLFRKHFRPSPRWSPDYIRENCDVEKDDDDDKSGKRSSLNFVRSFVHHRSVIDLAWTPRLGKSRWRMEKSERPIAADLVADPIACRNNADFSCIRATICFAAATVCVWLWTLGYSQPGLRLLVEEVNGEGKCASSPAVLCPPSRCVNRRCCVRVYARVCTPSSSIS